MKKIFFLWVFLGPLLVFSQVKIGANPEAIDAGSILELESFDKALVLSRLNNEQMTGLNPLEGALLYNSDTSCLHYYSGNQWINLCTVLSGIRFADNGDGTITLEDGQGDEITFNGADETVTTFTNNMDGTYTYTNEAGNQTLLNTMDNQTLSTNGDPGNIGISNGNTLVIDVEDADSDSQNEIQGLQFNNQEISLSNDPNNTTVDLSVYEDTETTLTQDNGTGVITYTNEASANQTANVISTDTDNEIAAGSDGGAFFQSSVKAFGKVAANGNIIRATAGIAVARLDADMNNVNDPGSYQINLPMGLVNDADYIIQISQPSRNGAGNDAPSITYLNQTSTSFEIFIGDNDNGGSNAAGFDSEFMFVIFDL